MKILFKIVELRNKTLIINYTSNIP